MSETLPAFASTLVDGAKAQPPAGFGAALAQARERAGLSLEELAGRLRLNARQLRALEREDLDVLPAAVYVGGFVRNYARELRLDARPLMEDLNAKLAARSAGRAAVEFSAPAASRLPVLDDRRWRQLVLAAIIAVLLCAGLIGSWMAHRPGQTSSAVAQRAAAPVPARLPEADRPAAGPEVRLADPRDPAAMAGPVSPAAPLAAVPAPVALVIAPASAPPAASAVAAAPTVAAGASPAPAAAGAKATGTRPTGAGLLLHFNERSWFEISQPDGRILMSRTGEPGSVEMINTAAPLQLIVGRAEAVQVEYHGQAVDLKPYVNNNGVARLGLADGRISALGTSKP